MVAVVRELRDDATTGGDAPGTGGMGTPPADDQDDETSSGDDKLIACSWTECLYENPDFKQAVRNLCSHVRFDPKDQKKYVAKGAKFRTASVLRMKLAQKQRDDKKKSKEDEDSDESDSDE